MDSDSNTDSESENAKFDDEFGNDREEDPPRLPDDTGTSSSFAQELEEEKKIISECHFVVPDKKGIAQNILDYTKFMMDKLTRTQFLDITNMLSDGNVFVVCGDSLLLSMMGNENWNCDNGGQMLHLVYLCERLLQMFSRKGGEFEIIFFKVWESSWIGNHTILLARSILQTHFQRNTSIRLHEFNSIWDSEFHRFLNILKPSFLLVDLNLPSICCNFLAKQSMTLADLTFCSQILFSVAHDLHCVDMSNVYLDVSTFHAFVIKGMHVLKQNLKKIRDQLNKIMKNEFHKIELVKMQLKPLEPYCAEDDQDARRIITVTAGAWYLIEESTNIHKEDWVRAFLLYSALLEVLPLKCRGMQSPVAKPTAELSHFIDQMHCQMKRAMASIAMFKYKYTNIADLWHGNLFVNTLTCMKNIPLYESIGQQTKMVYEDLMCKVNSIVGNTLDILPMKIENVHFYESSNIIEENSDILSSSQTPLSDLERLIPNNCRLTRDFCGDLLSEMLQQAGNYDCRIDKLISRNNDFDELHHWHSRTPLTDDCERIKSDNKFQKLTDPWEKRRYLKMQAKYAKFMSIYGSNIEGRPLTSKPIISRRGGKKESKKTKQSSKALAIIEKNLETKRKETEKTEERKLFEFEKMFKIMQLKGDYELCLKEVNKLLTSLSTDHCIQKVLMYRAKICSLIWYDECKRKNRPDRDLTSAKELFLVLRRLLNESKNKLPLSVVDSNTIGGWLCELGFFELAEQWELPTKHVDSTFTVGISWVRFQLCELGPELERVSEGVPDCRVDFIADPWQKDLFDVIDNHQSAVVVAPTSSGKTYASYYCMESILREDDEGIVVYVSPTKALVNQVAATVYARFKDKKMPDGMSVLGVFTRDYSSNYMNCQILITVPQCLELLLLSPRRHSWVQRLRYVIFDEVHCLAGQAGGISWECGLLLIQCPFLALSATIENPEVLHDWLQDSQNFKQERDKIDGVARNPKSYKVHLVVHSERHNDLKKYVYLPDENFQHLHPYSQIDATMVKKHKGISSYISLSPEETVQLYCSMELIAPKHPEVYDLKPETFFRDSGFITRSDAKIYAERLRCVLENFAFEDVQSFNSVIEHLKIQMQPYCGQMYIVDNLIKFVDHLKRRNMFPAILFSYNRSLVDHLFETLSNYYQSKIEKEEKDEHYSNKISNRLPEDSSLQKSKKNKEVRVSYQNKYQKSLSLFQGQSSSTLRGIGFVDSNDIKFIERRLMNSNNSLLINGLQVGIGKHHSGMNTKGKSAVEMLFRMKVLSLVFATGTLSLGIHMPCKTVVIVGDSIFLNSLEFHQMSGRAGRRGFDSSGNVIFFGLECRKVQTLLTGKLPCMIGNYPLSVTFVLRLLLLVSKVTFKGVRCEETTNRTLSRVLTFLNCTLVYQNIPELKHQIKLFFAFSTQLLILQGLLDDLGNPQILTGVVTHLHHHEPGNFVFVYLFRSGALRKLCWLDKNGVISKTLERNLILVLSYLFARKPLHPSDKKRKYKNSAVILPPLPTDIKNEIERYNEEVVFVYDHFYQQVAKHCASNLGDDDTLPLSNVRFAPTTNFEPTDAEMNLENEILKRSEPRKICSAFAALSGHTDKKLYSHSNVISNIRHQVFTDFKLVPYLDHEQVLNAYAWDFYNHGIVAAIEKDNGLKEGDAFNMLKDFMLMLHSIYTSLIELEPCDLNDPVLCVFKKITNTFSQKFHKAFYNSIFEQF